MSEKDLKAKILELAGQYCREKYVDQIFVPGETSIPVSGKVIGSAEIKNMIEASLDGWLTAGRFNAEFERKLAEFVGVDYALTVNSGSSANLVAFSAITSPSLGARAVAKGDEVITVAAGFPTTVNPAIQFGAVPVFVDVCDRTHNIDVNMLDSALSERTKAVMIAHALGNPFNIAAVKKFCSTHNLWLIEDCCDALGATYDGKHVGTFGDLATLSFYPAHHITMGEGGAVLTNSPELKKIAESFRDWGRDCYCPPGCDNTCGKRFEQQFGALPTGYDHKYTYSHLGYNLKISDMQASCALAQLERLPEFIKTRRDNFQYLLGRLSSTVGDYFEMPNATNGSDPSWFGFLLTIKEECDIKRVDLLRFLDSHNVGTRLLFAGNLIRQPYMKGIPFRVVGSLEKTDALMERAFWVGVFPGLSTAHLDYVCDLIEEYVGVGF